MPREWWETFFAGSWLDYQRGMDTPERVKPAADFLEIALRLEPGSRILDAPCGEGRLGRELARRGHHVTGLDASAVLLREAKRRAGAEGLTMDLQRGDMRRGPAGRRGYDLAVCWWSSFGYFSDADNLRHVKAMARSLRAGGIFVFDGHSSETIFPRFEERQWEEVGGVLATSLNEYDPYSGRLETEWTLNKGGRTRRACSSVRLYTVHELWALFTEAGFADCQCFGSLAGEPLDFDSRRLIFVARKG